MTRGVRSRRPGCRATATDISPKDLEPPLIALKTLNERSRKISILRISAPPISFFIPFSNLSFPFFFSSRLVSTNELPTNNLSLLILFFISFLARDCFMRIERQSLKVPPSPPSPPPALPPPEGKQCSAGEKEGKEKKRNEKKD